MESYLKNLICVTCLSSDRKLEIVQDNTTLVNLILLFPKFMKINVQEDRMCWECRTILLKLWRFHQRMLESKKILDNILINQAGVLNTLSWLKKREKVVHMNIDPQATPVQQGTANNLDHTLEIPSIKLEDKYLCTNPSVAQILRPDTQQLPVIRKSLCDMKKLNVVPLKVTSNNIVNNVADKNVNVTTEKELHKKSNIVSVKNVEVEYDSKLINVEPDNDDPVDYDRISIFSSENCLDDISDFDNSIMEHRIAKIQPNKINHVANSQLESNIKHKNKVCIPIVDMTHIKINTFKPKTLDENNAFENLNENTSKGSTDKTVTKEKRKRNRNRQKFKGIRIFNNVQEKEITESEMLELRDSEKNDKNYLEANFKCGDCIFGYKEYGLYKAHLYKHQANFGTEVCKVCEQRFRDSETLQAHSGTHFRAFYCIVCGFTGRFARSVARHSRAAHEQPGPFACTLCDATYSEAPRLDEHISAAHPASDPLRARHIASKMQAARAKVECKVCHKMISKKYLAIHMKNHYNEKQSNFCVECNKFVKHYDEHLKYNKRHTTAIYKCNDCGCKYPTKNSLRNHIMYIHLKNRKYVCDICSKSFMTRTHMNRHKERNHFGVVNEKKYMCSVCGKAFATSTILKVHLRTHTGEKPYHCEYCPWKFSQRSALCTHQKYKHKDKPPQKIT